MSNELNDKQLYELANTKYVEFESNNDDSNNIEVARSVDSYSFDQFQPNYASHFYNEDGDNFLNEMNKNLKQNSSEDEATQLLRFLKTASDDVLNNSILWCRLLEESEKWTRNTRISESELIFFILNQIDRRPAQLHFCCKRLIEIDIPNIIHKCLLVHPPLRFRSLFRLSIKTEMPIQQFIGQLEKLAITSPGFVVQKGMVTGLVNMSNTVHKMLTPEYAKYAKLEHLVTNQTLYTINSVARFKCTFVNRPHVRLNITFSNDFKTRNRRAKMIDIEQIVTPLNNLNRRVSFAPKEENIIYEYEISDQDPFIPLSRSRPAVKDFIRFLESLQNSIQNCST